MKDIFTGTFPLPESNPHPWSFLFGAFHFFHAIQTFLHGCRPLEHFFIISLRRPDTHIFYCLFHTFYLLLLFFIRILPQLHTAFFFFQVVRIVSQVFLHHAVFHFQGPRCHRIQETSVMGNQKHGSPVRFQIFFQPLQHGHIQMVGRFIQYEKIRLLEQCFCQAYQRLFTAAESVELRLQKGFGQLQPCADSGEAILCFIAALRFIFCLQSHISL